MDDNCSKEFLAALKSNFAELNFAQLDSFSRLPPDPRTSAKVVETTAQFNLLSRCNLFFSLGKRLNEYISHYETLSYDIKHLHAKHNRAKRALGEEQHVHLKFTSHGEHFHLRLKRDLTTFGDNLEVRLG